MCLNPHVLPLTMQPICMAVHHCAAANHVSFTIRQLQNHFGHKLDSEAQVRLLLAGKDATPSECALHPGRIVCQVERLLSA